MFGHAHHAFASGRVGRWLGKVPSKQSGQALVYGMFVLVGGLAGLFFLFNAGQLVREKTKLVNTADAVAYSAGVMNARALNFQAYGNRAMVANSVAIGQLVSLSSWATYAENLGTFGVVRALQPQFYPFYPSYYAAANAGSLLGQLNGGTLEKLAQTSDEIIHNVLARSQSVVYEGLLPTRAAVMNEVASANYLGDGRVTVDTASLLDADMGDFVKEYSGDKRERFKDVVETAVNKDPFVPKRTWKMPAILPSKCIAPDWLDRRGGTELLGLDEWRAKDTLSARQWRSTKLIACTPVEYPTGWGGRSAGEDSGEWNPEHHDRTWIVNPGATALTLSSNAWNYRGLPRFYDLSADALKQPDPRLQLAVRVRRDRTQTQTSEGRSAINGGTRLNDYKAHLKSGDDLVAVSASEAFFERSDRPQEIGSLFNPFWQVRLIHSAEGVDAAQQAKGVSLKAH